MSSDSGLLFVVRSILTGYHDIDLVRLLEASWTGMIHHNQLTIGLRSVGVIETVHIPSKKHGNIRCLGIILGSLLNAISRRQ